MASSLVQLLGKAHNGIPTSWCGRHMAGNSKASLFCCGEKHLYIWPATPKQASSALISFFVIGG